MAGAGATGGAPGAAGAIGGAASGGASGSSASSERRQMGHVACSCSHGAIQLAWKMWSHSNRDTVSPGIGNGR